jgi:hyperosmotically inducible periplasmic protein
MKALIVAAAVALAFPAFAQQKNDTTLPNAQERAQNRDKVENQADKAKDALPTTDERAKNRETVSSTAAGATLTTKVKTALASDAGLSTMTSIDVDSKDGVVTLKGKVDSADLKKKAGEVAKKVGGVKSVKNELRVEKKS